MIRSLRLFFLSRLLREKILLVAFALLGVAIWMSSLSTRLGQFRTAANTATAELETQAMWLGSQASIEAEAAKAAAQLDPARTLDSNDLYAEITSLVGAAGIPPTSLVNPQNRPDVTSGQFSIHTLDFTVNNVDWVPLKNFYASVLTRAPYVGVSYFDLRPRPNNPSQHQLMLRVSAIENTPR